MLNAPRSVFIKFVYTSVNSLNSLKTSLCVGAMHGALFVHTLSCTSYGQGSLERTADSHTPRHNTQTKVM